MRVGRHIYGLFHNAHERFDSTAPVFTFFTHASPAPADRFCARLAAQLRWRLRDRNRSQV